ncbi:hypothetical protein PVT71_01655 [Salipiger sp. H15]|uniref:Glycerol-3-phosphate dehydrogenase n=1 Tax=Alloyangia sp. H15 TaxID=3029062 RepID=A0AAU8AHN1_9RHOB
MTPRPAASGRLVLTPALRVQEPRPDERQGEEAAERERERHAAPVAARLFPAEEEVAEAARRNPLTLLRPEGEPAAASEDSVAEEEIEEAPFVEVEESAEGPLAEASIADFFALKLRDSTPPAPAVEPAPEPEAKEGSLARKIAELEEMIARSTTEFEPEQGEEAPAAIFRHQPAAQEPAAPQPVAVAEEDAELASRPMPEPELVDEPFPVAQEPEDLDETLLDEEPEDDNFARGHAGDEAAEAIEPEPAPAPRRPVKILRNPVWQRSQSSLRSEPASPVEDAPAPEAPLAGIDEDRLRQLVAEVVREELQGVLGDRVGRNVRKMVRRELQRILASDDQD